MYTAYGAVGVHCTLHKCTLNTEQWNFYTEQETLYTEQCTHYTEQCTQPYSLQPSLQAEDYGEAAFSSVYLLLLEVMGDTSGHARHAAVQLGKCEGLVTLLRGTPHNVNLRRVYLPSALLQQQGVSQEGLLRRGPLEEGVRDVVEILAERAQRHLEASRLRSRCPVYSI